MSKTKAKSKTVAAPAATSPNIDIGIANADRKKIAEGLSRFLADSYTLYLRPTTSTGT